MALIEQRDFWVGQIIYQLQGVVISDTEANTAYHLNKVLEGLSSLVALVAKEYGIEENVSIS